MRAEYHEPQVASSTPLKVLRRHLVAARRRGEAFEAAWPSAVKIALEDVKPSHRREWRDCMENTRSTWERCFDREPATPAEVALVNARGLIDREPLPDIGVNNAAVRWAPTRSATSTAAGTVHAKRPPWRPSKGSAAAAGRCSIRSCRSPLESRLAYGEWLLWLEKSFAASRKTGHVYMQVAAYVQRVWTFGREQFGGGRGSPKKATPCRARPAREAAES